MSEKTMEQQITQVSADVHSLLTRFEKFEETLEAYARDTIDTAKTVAVMEERSKQVAKDIEKLQVGYLAQAKLISRLQITIVGLVVSGGGLAGLSSLVGG